jgi:tRNA threonylcarbamoyladenosine biosynthesis protein TsaB
MRILAIDTATERCSVALRVDDRAIEQSVETPKGHAELILPMVEAVLAEGGLTLRQLDGIAYGRGPGAFTGVRIAIGVVQGLAFGADLPTIGISDLAAVAQQVAHPGDRVLVCMDARMGEVYAGAFVCRSSGLVQADSAERVLRPEDVIADHVTLLAGTGFKAYPQLAAGQSATVHDSVLPHAREIALLGEAGLRAGEGGDASRAQPVYLRDKVAVAKRS